LVDSSGVQEPRGEGEWVELSLQVGARNSLPGDEFVRYELDSELEPSDTDQTPDEELLILLLEAGLCKWARV